MTGGKIDEHRTCAQSNGLMADGSCRDAGAGVGVGGFEFVNKLRKAGDRRGGFESLHRRFTTALNDRAIALRLVPGGTFTDGKFIHSD